MILHADLRHLDLVPDSTRLFNIAMENPSQMEVSSWEDHQSMGHGFHGYVSHYQILLTIELPSGNLT